MVLSSLKARIMLTTMGLLVLSLSVITYYLVGEAKSSLTKSINQNALNILDVTVGYISSQHRNILQNQSEMHLIKRKRAKSNSAIAHSVLEHYFQEFQKGQITEEVAKQLAIKDVLGLRLDESVGHFWITDTFESPTIVMHSEFPALVGKMIDPKSFSCFENNKTNFFRLAVEITQNNDSGFVDCNWPSATKNLQSDSILYGPSKPNSANSDVSPEKQLYTERISFAKAFKPWGWVIGNTLTTQDIDEYTNSSFSTLIADISKILEPQKIGENGYFFIFKSDGYLLLHPVLAGQNGSKLINPVSGNSMLIDMKNAAMSNERLLKYIWDRPDDKGNYRYKKKAFLAYYQPLDWYVVTSVYNDDIDLLTSTLVTSAKVIFFISILVSLILSLLLIRSITKPLNDLVGAISGTDNTGVPTVEIPEGNLEEIKVLSRTMNLMISRIKEYQINFIDSELKFKSLVESVTDLIWELDKDGNYVYISPRIYDLLGYTPEEVIGNSPMMFMDSEETQAISPFLEQIFADGKGFQNLESKCFHKDGTPRTIEVSAAPFFNDKGELQGLRGVTRDITEKIKVARELHESEEKFKLLADQMLLGILIVKDGLYKYYNDAVLEIFGTTKQQMDSLGPYDLQTLIHPDDRAFVMDQLKKKERGHKDIVINYDWRLMSSNGKTKWVESWSKTIDFDGETADFVLLYDITERKDAENEVTHLRNYLSNVINSMPSILVGVDVEGKITQWNKTAVDRTNLCAEKVMGKHLSQVLPNLKPVFKKIEQSIKANKSVQTKISYQTKESNSVVQEVTVYPLEADGVEGAVIRIDDISEKVRMQEMMIQSEKMLSIAGLAAGMAHEINNPLAGMMQTASVMSNRLIKKVDMPANNDAAEHAGTTVDAIKQFMDERDIPRMINAINESGKRAAIIVNNMLNFARKDDGGVIASQINEIIRVSIELAETDYNMKKRYDFKKVSIDTEFGQNLPDLYCDQAQIQQVIFNLLRNSAQAMQEAQIESPQVRIRTSFNSDNNKVLIELFDNGPGMAEEVRKRVFEPFFTTKPTGIGTGLGLSVSYYIIVEEHGGEMYLDSAPGAGTKFTIALPLDRGESS